MDNKKILCIALSFGLCFTCITSAKEYSDGVQKTLADKVIRLHILANSDSDADQALKLSVRDGVLKMLTKTLKQNENINQTRDFLTQNTNEIQKCAEQIVKENGYSYDVSVSLTKSLFPTKIYDDVKFPPGMYEALRIVIGSGKGHNWWCVAFPPMCLVDATKKQSINKLALKHVLNDEQYDFVTRKSLPIKIKFKMVEMFKKEEVCVQ